MKNRDHYNWAISSWFMNWITVHFFRESLRFSLLSGISKFQNSGKKQMFSSCEMHLIFCFMYERRVNLHIYFEQFDYIKKKLKNHPNNKCTRLNTFTWLNKIGLEHIFFLISFHFIWICLVASYMANMPNSTTTQL